MIRKANNNDLSRIAYVHSICFPNSFSTKLGKKYKLLEKLYFEYLKDNPELFLVATNENKEIIGFCMGYYCEKNNYQKLFLKNNFFKILWRFIFLLIIFEPKAWNKLFEKFKQKKNVVLNEKISSLNLNSIGDLLSICVLPEFRGKGVANTLIKEYEKELLIQGRTVCILTVENNNKRGISFYKKNGYFPYIVKGTTETTFAHILTVIN